MLLQKKNVSREIAIGKPREKKSNHLGRKTLTGGVLWKDLPIIVKKTSYREVGKP